MVCRGPCGLRGLIAKYSSSAHELLLQSLVIPASVIVRANRGSAAPDLRRLRRCPRRHARTLDGVRRGGSTRPWGAGAPLDREQSRRDRLRRPVDRRSPSPRLPVATRSWRPEHDIRCRSGPVRHSPVCPFVQRISLCVPPKRHTTANRQRNPNWRPAMVAEWRASSTTSGPPTSTLPGGYLTICLVGRPARLLVRATGSPTTASCSRCRSTTRCGVRTTTYRRCGCRDCSRGIGPARSGASAASSDSVKVRSCARSSLVSRGSCRVEARSPSVPGCRYRAVRWLPCG